MNKIKGVSYVTAAASSYGVMAALVKLAYERGFGVFEVLGGQLAVSVFILWFLAIYQLYLKEIFATNDEEIQQLVSSETCYTDSVLDYVNNKAILDLPKKKIITYKDVWLLSIVGIFGPGLTAIFYFQALSLLPASVAIFLLFQFASVSMLLDWVITKERPSKIHLLSLGIIILGTILGLELWKFSYSSFPLIGIIFGIGSAFTFSIFLYFTGNIAKGVSPWLKSPIMVTGAATIILAIFQPSIYQSDEHFWNLLLWIIPISIFGQVIPNLFFNIGLPIVGGKLGSFLGTVELPSTLLMAYIILGEQIHFVQWIGMLCILAGVFIFGFNKSPT